MNRTALTAQPILLAICKERRDEKIWRCGLRDCGQKLLVRFKDDFHFEPGYIFSRGQGLYLKSRRAAYSMRHHRQNGDEFVYGDTDELEAIHIERECRLSKALLDFEAADAQFTAANPNPDPFNSNPPDVLDFINSIDMSDLDEREKTANKDVTRWKRRREDTWGATGYSLSGGLFFKCHQCGRISKITL